MAFDPIYRGPQGIDMAMNRVNQFQQWQQQALENQRIAERQRLIQEELMRKRQQEEAQRQAYTNIGKAMEQESYMMGPNQDGSAITPNYTEAIQSAIQSNFSPEMVTAASEYAQFLPKPEVGWQQANSGKGFWRIGEDGQPEFMEAPWNKGEQVKDDKGNWATEVDDRGNVYLVNRYTGEIKETNKRGQTKGGNQSPDSQDIPTDRKQNLIDNIREAIKETGYLTTGFIGNLMKDIAGTPAKDYAALLEPIRAEIAFGTLQEMRNASKTGGALGQVSEIELKLLESSLESLDQAQSPTQMRKALTEIMNIQQKWLDAKKQNPSEAKVLGGGTFGVMAGNANNGWSMERVD